MRYYVDTISQTVKDGEYQEFGKRESKASMESALSAFYDALATVAKTSSYVYFDIKIVNSKGGIEKKDQIGEYIEVTATTTDS